MLNGNSNRNQEKILVDSAIRARSILVIDGETNQNLGIMPLHEALDLASKRGLNLVQMGPATQGRAPTCKILDYGKFRYDESKRAKLIAKKQRESQIEEKEIAFRVSTGLNDLKTKAKKADEFLKEGARVTLTLKPSKDKGSHRELTRFDMVDELLCQFLDFIPGASIVPVSTDRTKLTFSLVRKSEEVKKSG